MPTLLAIDGLNIVRRVYEAGRNHDEPDTPETAEAALRAALASFRKLLATHAPSHALAAFDAGGHTWRHALHPAYRAQKAPMPDVLKERLPGFFLQLEQLGLKTVAVPGVEADDVIATAVLRWLNEGRGEAIVASTDKDLHVLAAHGALLWDHFKGEWHDARWIEEKFGVRPDQLPDLLALVGDPSDGIPGVSKIGLKTAARLLHGYGDLDGVMAGAGILKDALGERLRKERDNLVLSRRLVALKSDVRIGVTWNMLACSPR